MATTVAALAAEGRGRIGFILEIPGIGIFSSCSCDPTGEDWYDDGGYSSAPSPWLVFDVDDLSDQIDPLSAGLEVSNLGLVIADSSGQMTALIKDIRAWTRTRLTWTLSATATSKVQVEDTSAFLASGYVYIGQECIHYTSKDSDHFIGLTRGVYNTTVVEHYADTTYPPGGVAITPWVAAGPHSVTNRRAILRMAVVDERTGSLGTSSVIYRGRVTKGTRVGRGRYEISLEHISALLRDKIGTELATVPIGRKQAWYDGTDDNRALGWYRTAYRNTSTDDTYVGRVVIAAGRYRIGAQLTRVLATTHWNLIAVTWGLSNPPHWVVTEASGSRTARLTAGTSAVFESSVTVRKGDPLWALGFDPAMHVQPAGATDPFVVEAENQPRRCVIDFGLACRDGFGASGSPEILGSSSERLPLVHAGTYIAAPDQPAVKWSDVSVSVYTLDGGTIDRIPTTSRLSWLIEKEEDAKFQQVVYLRGTLKEVLLEGLGLGGSSQVSPLRWVASGMVADDIDTDELDDVLSSVEPVLNEVFHVVLEPTELWSIIGPQFAALGICPRITSEGRIGWTYQRTPILTDAVDVELDEDMWAAAEASQVESRLDATPLISEALIRWGYDYRAGSDGIEWRQPERFKWPEGADVIGRSRSVTFECPGLWSRGVAYDVFYAALRDRLVFGVFSTMGRETSTVEIACTWTARQLYCGDVVKITHELAPDTVEGTIGLSGRLGLVVGRRFKLTDSGTDTLVVRLGPDVYSGGIAPCVLITSDDSDSQGTVADDEVYSDDDLDLFAAGDAVLLVEYDSTSPATVVAEIDEISGDTVSLTAAVFDGDVSAPCWMIPVEWDDAEDVHKAYAYIADAAATPTLGTAEDDAMEWVL